MTQAPDQAPVPRVPGSSAKGDTGAAMFGRDELDSLPGRTFPGGSFLISGPEDDRMRDVVGAPPRQADVAHPIWLFAAPQRALGITIDEFFAWCGSSSAEGPMLGETRLTMPRPLRVGRNYAVSGRIVAVQRKEGRRAGTFDIVTFELQLAERGSGDGGWQARTGFVFPRRS